MKRFLEQGLQSIEKDGEITALSRVSGGDINEAYYVRTKENEYFVKLNRGVDLSFFPLKPWDCK